MDNFLLTYSTYFTPNLNSIHPDVQVGGLRDYYLFKRKDGRRKKREIFAPLIEDNEVRQWNDTV